MMANKKTTKSTKTTKKVVKKENVVVAHTEWQNVGMLAQLILSVSVLFFGGLCIFNNDFLIAVEKLLGLTIITMAYNNHFTYKRKGMTIVYAIFGIAIFVIACMGW